MTCGGKRQGAGRPSVPDEKKAKKVSFKLYSWEVEKVQQFIKIIRKNSVLDE